MESQKAITIPLKIIICPGRFPDHVEASRDQQPERYFWNLVEVRVRFFPRNF
jgi:hypothetical protein